MDIRESSRSREARVVDRRDLVVSVRVLQVEGELRHCFQVFDPDGGEVYHQSYVAFWDPKEALKRGIECARSKLRRKSEEWEWGI